MDDLKIKELFKAPCVIEEYEENGKINYGVGFHWEDGTKSGIEVSRMEEIPIALAQFGAYILKTKLGWEPQKIVSPEKKIIVPGRN